MWLKQNRCLHMCRGLGTCTGAISTAQLGSGNLLSHGNLPARGGVIKKLSPFPSRLRASPPCQGSRSVPLAPAAPGLPFAHAAGAFLAQLCVDRFLSEKHKCPPSPCVGPAVVPPTCTPCPVGHSSVGPNPRGGCSVLGQVGDAPK